MKKFTFLRTAAALGGSSLVLSFAIASSAGAVASPPSPTVTLQSVKAEATGRISKRVTTLGKLSAAVNSFKYGNPTNQATLQTQITSSTSGLNKLQTTINAETDLAKAKAEDQSIYTDYRVYMLVAPKVYVVKVADDQQAKEASLLLLTSLLQPYVHASTEANALQPKLTTAIGQIQQAQKTSQTAESKVLPLVPSDWNSNHDLMTSYFTQLKSAKTQLSTAYATLKDVVNTLQKSQEGFLTFTEWGVKMPVSGKLTKATYQDITSVYSLPYSTIQVVVSGGQVPETCKGGVVGWIQRVPDTIPQSNTLGLAHIGSYNYVTRGVTDCLTSGNSTLIAQFYQDVDKMVATQ